MTELEFALIAALAAAFIIIIYLVNFQKATLDKVAASIPNEALAVLVAMTAAGNTELQKRVSATPNKFDDTLLAALQKLLDFPVEESADSEPPAAG